MLVVPARGDAVGVERRLVPAVQLGLVGGVAAQRRREHRRRRRSTACASGWTGSGSRRRPTRKTESHSRPLARWTVSSLTESASVGVGDVEAVALVVLGGQVGEQRGQRDVAVDRLELGDRLEEQVEVVAPGRRGGADRRGELDVDAGGVDDAPDDVEDRLPGVRPERAQLAGEQREALQRLRGVRRVAGILERVAERRQLGRVDAVGDLGQLVADRGALGAAAAPGQLGGAVLEQPQVARPDRPARAGEQGEHRGVGGHVVEQLEHRDDLGHLGQPEQARRGRRSRPGCRRRSGRRRPPRRCCCRGSGRRCRTSALRSSGASRTCLGEPARARRPGSRRRATPTWPSAASGLGSSGRDHAA